MRRLAIAAFLILVFSITGCTAPKIRLFPSQADPLREFTLEGESEPKILIVPNTGGDIKRTQGGIYPHATEHRAGGCFSAPAGRRR